MHPDTAHIARALELFPPLRDAPPDCLERLRDETQLLQAPAGARLFDERAHCTAFPLVLDGAIRVSKISAQGREILLYRVAPGESCVLTSGCLLGHIDYAATGIAETDVTLIAVPLPLFDLLLARHEPFRRHVFELFSARLSDLMLHAGNLGVAMRCGGCGAKVGPTVLSRALAGIHPIERDDVLIGLHAPDDAAVLRVPPGSALVHTVDFFRAFIDDPWLLGRIAANHALGDVFAMGGVPQSATAIATVPPGLESKVEDTVFQMVAGAVEVLDEAGCALAGGHTGEGSELALGFAVNGLIDEKLDGVLRKGGMRPGDALILTKPIGTGTLLAAHARLKARGRWIDLHPVALHPVLHPSPGQPFGHLPEVDLVAVTCVGGNIDARQVAENTRAVLELAGRGDVEDALGREHRSRDRSKSPPRPTVPRGSAMPCSRRRAVRSRRVTPPT